MNVKRCICALLAVVTLLTSVPAASALTAEEAKTELSPALTPDTVTLCLLCRGTEETLCYACRAAKGERTYIVYLNAQTGAEEEIQELQTSEDGETLR